MAPFSGDSRSIARVGAASGCVVGVRLRKNAQERVRFALEARLDGPTPRAAGVLEPAREQRHKLTHGRRGGNSTQQRTRHGRSSRSLLAAACRRSQSELELLLVHQLALLAEALYLRRRNNGPTRCCALALSATQNLRAEPAAPFLSATGDAERQSAADTRSTRAEGTSVPEAGRRQTSGVQE